MTILLLSFLVLIIIGMPISFAMLSSSVLYLFANQISSEVLIQRLGAGVNSFPLLAVPFFILAGSIMNSAGITEKIFNFADHVVGHLTGGLGHANVLASLIFSGMSGSAVADAGGLGSIELKAMKQAGYDDDFSLAVTGASSIVGPIIPPSIPAVVYGVIGGVSIGRLFLGGIIPGLIMSGAISILVYFIAKKKNYTKRKRATFKELIDAFKDAFLALLTPILIIGGIIGGVVTPTEAAIIAVFYSLFLGFLYKEISIKDLPRFLDETIKSTVGILFIIACAALFGWLITTTQVPQTLATAFLGVVTNRFLALICIIAFLLFVGCFMECLAALTIMVPILAPITTSLGIDPVHFGIITIITLMIGLMTPPVGMVLYVLSSISNVSVERITKSILPFVGVLIVVIVIIMFCPQIVTFLPNLLLD